ncbi:MAG: serine/threonine-protein kinase, partial [Planctomycetota bacterium]|nr:serine/threonine-protein kinase [Planctomycetota bacterium]
MTVSPDPHWSNFLQIAERINLLSGDVIEQLKNDSKMRQRSPAELAVQHGWMNSVQVDIVTTLMHPRTTIPGYEILDVIGQGGMGVVFRAKQLNLDRVVALKTVLFSQVGDPSILERFRQEAITVAKLRHPNIVTAYDFGQHEGRLYFAMEMIEGNDLDGLIRQNGTLDPGTALGLLRQTIAGLAHASQLGVVHRDIKPANLLLVEAPEGYGLPNGLPMVKIADFGLAFLTATSESSTRLTMNNAVVGSPNYLAPEQLSGHRVDHRADIYALGATFYHMLSGSPPYVGDNVTQIITQKLSGQFRPIARQPESINLFVQSLMKLDPADRPSDYGLIRQEIDLLATTLVPETIFISGNNRPSTITAETSDDDRQNKLVANPLANEPQATSVNLLATQPVDPRNRHHDAEATLILQRPSLRRRWFISLLVGALAVVAVVYGLRDRGKPDKPRPTRTLARGEWFDHLFDGRTLSGWSTMSGGWSINNHPDHGAVLSGERGTIRRQLMREHDEKETSIDGLEHYVVTLLVMLNNADRISIEFGLKNEAQTGYPRFALVVTKQGLQLGRRSDQPNSFEPMQGEIAID